MIAPSRGERLAFGFYAEGQKQDADDEGKGRHRDGDAERFKMADSRANKQSEKSGGKAADIGGEGKRAGAAFRGVLLREPKRIDDEVRAAETKKKGADEEPLEGVSVQVEYAAEGHKNRNAH